MVKAGFVAECMACLWSLVPDLGYKTRENSNFQKNGKTIILVKIQKFSRFRMTKRTSLLEPSREI